MRPFEVAAIYIARIDIHNVFVSCLEFSLRNTFSIVLSDIVMGICSKGRETHMDQRVSRTLFTDKLILMLQRLQLNLIHLYQNT